MKGLEEKFMSLFKVIIIVLKLLFDKFFCWVFGLFFFLWVLGVGVLGLRIILVVVWGVIIGFLEVGKL